MDEQRVSVEELEQALAPDVRRLAEGIADAMNQAQAGRIIADTEELVRDAHAEFRERAFQKAISLLQSKQEAFSPSARRTEEQGQADDDSSNGQRPHPRG